MRINTIRESFLFDRLRARISEDLNMPVLPGMENTTREQQALIDKLNNAELLLPPTSISERLDVENTPPEDLRKSFQIPFDTIFMEFHQPVVIKTGKNHMKLRAMLVFKLAEKEYRTASRLVAKSAGAKSTDIGDLYRVQVWEERRGGIVGVPSRIFDFAPSIGFAGDNSDEWNQKLADLLVWIAGYINSHNVMAIRHNRRQTGKQNLPSYYTFSEISLESRPVSSGKIRNTEVSGHFRRAHWHALPLGRGKAWYPTSWVRPHKRRVPEHVDSSSQAA